MTPISYPDTLLLINGQWAESADGKFLQVLNPASEQVIGRVAAAGPADLERAAQAAQSGFTAWRKIPAHERAAIMRKAAGLLRDRANKVAQLMTLEQGKPLGEARGEVLAAVDIIEWFADEGRRIHGRILPPRNPATEQFVIKEPVGPVAAFTPWNFPINQVVRKLSAALATGCSFLVKAAEETPASPAELIRAFVDAGVPNGVVGLVYGDPAQISSFLIPHPLIRKVSFTGSTAVGKQLAALAGTHMKRATMELGGHAPVIIAADADVDLAVKTVGAAKFRNAGQVCISPTRFLVHQSLKSEFTQKLVAYAEGLKVGDGLADGTMMGPVANKRRLAAMDAVTADAREKGAVVATGGERLGKEGYFFAPTVITDIPANAKLINDEPFGPIAAVAAFDTIDEAIAEANRLPFGLAGYAFASSSKTIHALTHDVEVGLLWINQGPAPAVEIPFGGVKDSGYGSEGGSEALEPYLVTKSVAILPT